MSESKQTIVRTVSLTRYALILAVIWTSLVGASLFWNIRNERQGVLDLARAEARGVYNKDLVYRRWVSGHGGVYVPVTDETPPNPYLSHVKTRDIVTNSGLRLTLVNPAYMTRQVHELGLEQYGIRGHITSLNPVRPENAPDEWEAEALRTFERGRLEVDSIEKIDGQTYLRLMLPMTTEKRCLKCHAQQGYHVGDIRGGVSVSVPIAPYQAMARAHMIPLTLGHGMIWILGFSGLCLGTVQLSRRVRERERAKAALQDSLEDSRRRQMEVSALLEGSRFILEYKYFKDAARSIFDSCKRLLGATAGYVALLSEDGLLNEVLFLDAGGHPCTVDPNLPMPIRGLRGETYGKGEVTYDNDFVQSEWMKYMPEGHVTLDNVLFAPLVIEGKAVGLIGLANKPGGFIEADTRLAAAFGELAAISLRNSQSLETLESNEKRFRTLIDTAQAVILYLSPDGRILEFNRFAELLYGRKKEEVLDHDYVRMFLPEEARGEVANYINKILSGEPTQDYENTIKATDGTEHVLLWNVGPLLDDKGNPLGIIAVGIDVTERKRTEEELEKHREHLKELVRERTDELQAMVNAMSGREMRMAELKEAIRSLRVQLEDAGLTPVADDPLKEGSEK